MLQTGNHSLISLRIRDNYSMINLKGGSNTSSHVIPTDAGIYLVLN